MFSIRETKLSLKGGTHQQIGPLLITHFGFSGPCVLKLSAWEAPLLFESGYEIELDVCWLPSKNREVLIKELLELKEKRPKSTLLRENPFSLPKSLLKALMKEGMEKALLPLCLIKKFILLPKGSCGIPT